MSFARRAVLDVKVIDDSFYAVDVPYFEASQHFVALAGDGAGQRNRAVRNSRNDGESPKCLFILQDSFHVMHELGIARGRCSALCKGVGEEEGACSDGKSNGSKGEFVHDRDSNSQFLSDGINDLETDPVIDGGRGIGRRLCVVRDGLRGRVAELLKRIFAGDGLGVAVKELALGVNV